jgi:hypothetical protein
VREYERTILQEARENGIVFTKSRERPEYDYYAGLDPGFTHDASALCITELKYEPVGRRYTHTMKMPNYANGGSVDVQQLR